MYSTVGAASTGGIRHGQKAVLSQVRVLGGPGGPERGEDSRADRQAIRHPPQLYGAFEEGLPRARA